MPNKVHFLKGYGGEKKFSMLVQDRTPYPLTQLFQNDRVC
jgi:hypothetical protein